MMGYRVGEREENVARSSYSPGKLGVLFLAPVLALLLLVLPTPGGMSVEGHRAGAVALLMVAWWVTEALPLAATALLPLALFPLLGVMSGKATASAYGDANIFLFAGGFFIAMAMQKCGLHVRIALNIVTRTGTNPRGLVLGFMVATAFLSMWISNTATTLMMLPIALAVSDYLETDTPDRGIGNFPACLLLSIAYAASIGGVGTLVGTPPNIVLAAQYAEMFPDAEPIGFLQWMCVGIPFVLLFLPLAWIFLTRVLFRLDARSDCRASDEIRRRKTALGSMSRAEKIVLTVSAMTALSWIFRKNIDLGLFSIPGWSSLFPNPGGIHDGTVAIFFAVLLFAIPTDLRKGEFALDWEWAKRIPWGVLLLFGGGLALAKAFKETGLVEWLGACFVHLSVLPPVLVVLMIALTLTFLTEMTSNTATTTIMLPLLGGAAALAIGVDPLLLMIPAAISASCAFMLPVATPPNAIVFGSGRITVEQMAWAGLLFNLAGALLVTLLTWFLAVPVFGIKITFGL